MRDVLIIGNPNSGKSLLFNRLTGLSQKVANYPGITVDIREGIKNGIRYIDFPGIYSLEAISRDESVAVEKFETALTSVSTRAVLYVLDATRFERSLSLLLQILPLARQHQVPVIVAANVIDELPPGTLKTETFGARLGVRVMPVSAKRKTGVAALEKLLIGIAQENSEVLLSLPPTSDFKSQGFNSGLAQSLAKEFGPQTDSLIRRQNRLDDFFLSPFLGLLCFSAIMLLLFQSIFSWAAPIMDLLSTVIAQSGNLIAGFFPTGILADFVRGALFEGLGSFLVFAPQIFVLFVIIGILEDSGYLARAALIMHRPLSFFGLSGKSFIPLLSGHACAIPALLATRMIESPRKRLLTIIAVPFMGCSARIPIYALLIAAFIPPTPILGFFITLQGLVFFGLYATGLIAGLLATAFLNWVVLNKKHQNSDPPLILELPPYRLPSTLPILRRASSQTFNFIKEAGLVIFIVTIVIWCLGYFPYGEGRLTESYLAWLGTKIEFLFRPMGMDWKIGVAVLTSFLAREVFVGTLGTLHGIEAVDDNIASLVENLRSGGLTTASAFALLIFYALAMQCVSTLAVVKKETGSRWLPVALFVGMTLLAYGASYLTFEVLR